MNATLNNEAAVRLVDRTDGRAGHARFPPVVWRSLKPEPAKYVVIPTTCLENPEDRAPTWQGGIDSRLPWMQTHDDLPRAGCPQSSLTRSAGE